MPGTTSTFSAQSFSLSTLPSCCWALMLVQGLAALVAWWHLSVLGPQARTGTGHFCDRTVLHHSISILKGDFLRQCLKTHLFCQSCCQDHAQGVDCEEAPCFPVYLWAQCDKCTVPVWSFRDCELVQVSLLVSRTCAESEWSAINFIESPQHVMGLMEEWCFSGGNWELPGKPRRSAGTVGAQSQQEWSQ